jgi:protein Tex
VRRISASTGCDMRALIGNREVLRSLRPADFVDETFGLPTVADILAELDKPGRDPRPAFQTAAFTDGVEKLADLRPGMVLEGVVTNVAAFGAFVDIGVHQDGLVHISAMSKSFVKDPRDVVKSGDVVRVKVREVDVARSRISLTLRLDDETDGAGGGRSGTADSGPRTADRGLRTGAGKRQRAPRQEQAPDTALADALRRAGLTGGSGRD